MERMEKKDAGESEVRVSVRRHKELRLNKLQNKKIRRQYEGLERS